MIEIGAMAEAGMKFVEVGRRTNLRLDSAGTVVAAIISL